MLLYYELAAAAAAGVASHLCLFIHGEWHMLGARLLYTYTLLSGLLFFAQLRYGGLDMMASWKASMLIINAYAGALFASIAIYRRYFHRLRHFPGPPMAAITKFWHVYKNLNSKNHLLLEELYQKYGPIVRTGPAELSIVDPEIFKALDGPGNTCTKAPWYDFLLPEVALNTTRDKPTHDKRRRIWDHGFTTKALSQYEDRVHEYAERLDKHFAIAAAQNESVNILNWINWFAFDVMGEFAFARSFDMLENEKYHIAIVMLRKAMRLLGPLSPVPWLAQMGFEIVPWMYGVRDWHRMLDWCRNCMSERLKMKPEKADVSSWLIAHSEKNNTMAADRHWLNGDAVTIIIAGSGTVAPTLVFLFYELAINPQRAAELRAEVSQVDIYDKRALQPLHCLNAWIDETMRLHPSVPTGGYRETGPEGMTVAGQFIPPYTTVAASRYSIGRLESCFEKADEFWPERWYSKPYMVKNKAAYSPFAQGRYACVGKNLALEEMRFVIALLVSKYYISLAPGEDGVAVLRDTTDEFTAAPGNLYLSFKAVEKPE